MRRTNQVYIFRNPVTNLLKIGTTTDFKNRLRVISYEENQVLEILLIMPGSYPLERKLHTKFKHLKVKGEWFKNSPEIVSYIDNRIKHLHYLERCKIPWFITSPNRAPWE